LHDLQRLTLARLDCTPTAAWWTGHDPLHRCDIDGALDRLFEDALAFEEPFGAAQ
jgi:hypothetical protein